MSENIDINKLKIEVDEIKDSIINLKNNVENFEDKKKQVEELKLKTNETKTKMLKMKMNFLESKTSNESETKKKEFETLLNSLNEYESILNSLNTTKHDESNQETKENNNIIDKAQDWIGEQWNDFLNWDKRKEQPGWTILRLIGFGATGYALVKGIKKLRNTTFGDESENKGFFDKWYGKALKWSIIGTPIYYVSKGLITGDWSIFGWNPFSGEKKDGISTIPGSDIESSEKYYEKLSQEDKQIYEASANAINEYQGNIMGDQKGSNMIEDLMGDSEFDKDKIGLIPFMLSNRYDSLNKMLSETSFYYEILGTEGHIARDKLKKFGLNGIKEFFSPLVGKVDGLTSDLFNLNDGLDNIIEKLKGVEGLEGVLRTVFRKSITVMSYYQSRKGALESKLAEQKLMKSDPKFSNLSEEDKIETITDHLHDEERYKQNIESEISEFMKLNLKNATKYLQEKGLLKGELDPSVSLVMDKVEERRKDLLNIDDEDDTSILEDIKSELDNGKLSEKAQKKLKNICEDFEEEIYTKGREYWYTKYFPMLQVLDGGEQVMNEIQKCGDYENIANKYKEQIDSILKKTKDGILQESDLDLLEETINDYYKFQKSLASSEINISKSVDERGNIVFRRGRSLIAGGQNIRDGVEIVLEKKEGSNLEGRGLIGGGVLSVDALTFGLAGKKVVGFSPFWTLNKRITFPIVKGSLKLTGKGIERLTGNVMRANLGGFVPSCLYTEDTLKIAVARGDITLDKAVKIANKNGFKAGSGPNVPTINNKIDLMKRMLNLTDKEASRLTNVIDKFGDNPNIYKKILKYRYDWTRSSRRKPTDRFHLDRSKKLFELNNAVLSKLEGIAIRVDEMPTGAEKKVIQSMMRYIKDIDQAEDFAIMGVGDDMVKLLESKKFMEPEKYGKYLAKYAGEIDADDMRAFEKFIIEAKNNGKIGKNTGLFIRNSMKNFTKIKKNGFDINKIDKLALNSTKWSKLAETTKNSCNNMTTRLRNMVKNPKFKPFHPNIEKQIKAIEEFKKKITPESVKAMKNISIFSRVRGFSKLSAKGMHELSRLSYMLRDVDVASDLAKSLKGAKTLDNVKYILEQKGILVNEIDDEVLLKIAKAGNTKKIRDIVNYGAEFESIQGVQKLMSNPAIKHIGRIGGKTIIGLDFLFVGYKFYEGYGEAQNVKQYNLERGERREGQSYYELGTGGLGAVAGACMFIPGAGWVAGGVLAASMVAMEIGNKYYEDINKFKQNQADFLSKGIAATKQELTSIDSWDQGVSRTWIDAINLGGSETKKKIGTPKTKSEALKALIKMEELQKNPLAGADSNDPDIIKNPELTETIRSAKQQVEEIVQKRFNFFKVNYLDKNKPIIEKSKIKVNQAMSAIESSLELSAIYAAMDGDTNYTGEKTPEKYKEEKLQELKKGNEGNFKKLEKIMEENPTLLFQMYAELPNYRSMLSQYGGEDGEKLLDTCNYFEQYMVYKLLGKPVTSYPSVDVNPDEIDYNQIHNFMSDFTIVPTKLDENESKNYKGLSDKKILEQYNISGILGQDILFECAKLLSYNGKNSLNDLKSFFHETKKEVNGIYYDGNDRAINENNGSDDEFAKDTELNSIENIEKMREFIDDNVNGSFIHGTMLTENKSINKEIGNKMIKIIDEYLSLRKGNISGKIRKYIKDYSKGKYITLPINLVIEGRKAGLEGVGIHLYKYENGKIIKNP